MTYIKEGQAGGAVGAIITMIMGVGIAVLTLIFIGSLGGQTWEMVEDDISAIGNNTIISESIVANNVTAQNFAHHFIQSGTLSIVNGTTAVNLGNFTIDYDAGTLLLSGDMAYNGSTLTANYTWGAAEIRTSVQNGVISSFEALEQTGDYLPIIVLAVVITLVMALVLSLGGLGGMRSGGTAL
jgi:hypothetical protein